MLIKHIPIPENYISSPVPQNNLMFFPTRRGVRKIFVGTIKLQNWKVHTFWKTMVGDFFPNFYNDHLNLFNVWLPAYIFSVLKISPHICIMIWGANEPKWLKCLYLFSSPKKLFISLPGVLELEYRYEYLIKTNETTKKHIRITYWCEINLLNM